jgi:hypothetical protein
MPKDSHDDYGNPLTPVYRHEAIGYFDQDERSALADALGVVAKYMDNREYGEPTAASFEFKLDGGTYTLAFTPDAK